MAFMYYIIESPEKISGDTMVLYESHHHRRRDFLVIMITKKNLNPIDFIFGRQQDMGEMPAKFDIWPNRYRAKNPYFGEYIKFYIQTGNGMGHKLTKFEKIGPGVRAKWGG